MEDRLTKDTSDSCEAISTQNGLCKKDPASCPMVHLNKLNYGSAIRKNFQTSSALGLVCETKKRRSSTEAIKLCTEGKDWIIPEYATASFSFLDMMQSGYSNDFLKLEMEKIHTTIKKRSISQSILLTGPIILSPGFEKEVVWNLWWQELALKGTSKSIHESAESQELALLRTKRFIVSGTFCNNIRSSCHNHFSGDCTRDFYK